MIRHALLAESLQRLWRWCTRDAIRGGVLAAALVAVVGELDYLTGYEVRLSILYLAPIALATWTGGKRAGTLACIGAVTWWGVSFHPDHRYSREVFYLWEGLMLAATFLIFMLLLNRLRDALARADRRFLHVLEGLSAGIYAVDDAGRRVLYANRRFADMIGTDPASVPAAQFDERFKPAAPLPQSHDDDPATFRYEEARDEKTGNWYLIQSGRISWENNTQVQLKVLMDITARKQAAALKRRNQEMLHNAARVSVLAEIASMLGHEINQPLMAIATYNEACILLLSKDEPDLAEVKVALEKCRAQAVRASHIVDRTRGFLQRRAPSLVHARINNVVLDAVRSLELELQDAAITVDLRLANESRDGEFDRTLIEQVVINLLRNAVDAVQTTDPSRRNITVLTALDDDGAMRVSVIDNGCGIADDGMDRLYTPFFTTKPQGLGLGLCICRSIVEAHAGRLWHDANPEGGAAFHFTLPHTLHA